MGVVASVELEQPLRLMFQDEALWADQRLLLLLAQETGASDGQGDVEPPVRVRLRRGQPA